MLQTPQSLLIDILLHCNVAHQSWELRLSSPLAVSQLRSENRIWSQLLQKPRFCQQTSPPELPSSPQLDSGSWSFLELSIANKPPTQSGQICLICFTVRPLASRSSSQPCRRLFVIPAENSLMWSRSPSLFQFVLHGGMFVYHKMYKVLHFSSVRVYSPAMVMMI